MNPPKYPTPSRSPVLRSPNSQRLKVMTLLTTREVAEYLRTSTGAVHNMVYRKQLQAFKPGGRLLFKKEDIDRWVERGRLSAVYGN